MLKAVFLQIGAALIATLVGAMIWGAPGAISAALGGAACIIPNSLFALRLALVSRRAGASYSTAFFVGEMIKLAATIGLLAAIRLAYEDVLWLALFIGLVLTLKANLFAFLVKT